MKKILLFLLLISAKAFAATITIAVAANVSYAIEDIKAEFIKTYPQTRVRVVLGSSGKLTAQIRNGAPYGLFMSANMKYPQALYVDGLSILKPEMYAQGALSILSAKKRDFSVGVDILKDKNIKRIALANPKTAPYGIAAVQALKKAGLYDDLKKKFVYGESISQTVYYALTAADIGIVSSSSLYSPKMKHLKENTHWIGIDTRLYHPIRQGIVLLKQAKGIKEYKDFYDFILSEKAKVIFTKHGYLI